MAQEALISRAYAVIEENQRLRDELEKLKRERDELRSELHRSRLENAMLKRGRPRHGEKDNSG